MPYINAKMAEYAAGFHDGRMDYELNFIPDKTLGAYYLQGYKDGVETRTEEDKDRICQ